MGKLIDTDDLIFQPSKVGMRLFDHVCRATIDSIPAVDPEDLDVVKALRAENDALKAELMELKK